MLKELKNGWDNNGLYVPTNETNNDYQEIKKYIAKGGEYEKFDFLSDAKFEKIQEIEQFHASDEVKKLTIKAGTLEAHIGVDQNSRYLLDEQIGLLRIRIESKEINPTWTYQNGVSVPLNLDQLTRLRMFIGQLTDHNFKAKRDSIKLINVLKTINKVENFDFKKNYKINQIIAMTI